VFATQQRSHPARVDVYPERKPSPPQTGGFVRCISLVRGGRERVRRIDVGDRYELSPLRGRTFARAARALSRSVEGAQTRQTCLGLY